MKEREREKEIEKEKGKEIERERERDKGKEQSRLWGNAPASAAASVFAPEIAPPTPAPAPQKLLPARKNPFLKTSILPTAVSSADVGKAPEMKPEKALSRVQQMIKDKEQASNRRPSLNVPLPSPSCRKEKQKPVESLDDYDEDVVEF